jgi:hypothetical protein
MSEILYAEGPDLERVLARIRFEHGVEIRVLTVSYPRRGGVAGFFPREICAVSYEICAEPAAPTPEAVIPSPEEVVEIGSSEPIAEVLSDLIDSADAADGPASLQVLRPKRIPTAKLPGPSAPARPAGPLRIDEAVALDSALDAPHPSVLDDDFAAILAAAVTRPAHPMPTAPGPSPRQAIDDLAEERSHRAGSSRPEPEPTSERPQPPAKARLGVLAALREVGVPVPLNPESGETSLYRAVEQVIEQLPAAPRPPRRPGEILALVGPLTEAMKIASILADELRIPQRAVWVVDPTDRGGFDQVIRGPRDAARHADSMCLQETPSIVVVDTAPDDTLIGDDVSWCAEILAAVAPQAVWALIDASRKTADVAAELERLGRVDALAVYSVTKTSSPATVWDLDIPVALLDGRPASPGVWAALLFDVLGRPTSRAHVTVS